jgi:hypothetical protein
MQNPAARAHRGGIAQRSRELGPVPFTNAIDLRRNRRYLRYALPPLAVLIVLLFAAPSLITGPTERSSPRSEFAPEAPFRFILLNDSPHRSRGAGLRGHVELERQAIPQQVEVDIDGQRIPLVKQDAVHFTHRFRNVQEPSISTFTAEGFNSKELHIEHHSGSTACWTSPALEYPPYLGLPNETASNTMATSPCPPAPASPGRANARSADCCCSPSTTPPSLLTPSPNEATSAFRASVAFLQSRTYRMDPTNGDRAAAETPAIPRGGGARPLPHHPGGDQTDSTAPKRLFFRGDVADDHGFKRLLFQLPLRERRRQCGRRTARAARERAADRPEQHPPGVLPLLGLYTIHHVARVISSSTGSRCGTTMA